MSNDFKNFCSAYLKIKKDLERLGRTLNPSYLDVYRQMELALEPILHQHIKRETTQSQDIRGGV